MNEKNQITEGVIWKQLLLFFFPVVAGTFLQQIYNAADTIVVGRFVGKEALAAVGGSVNQIVNLIVEVFVGLTSGASVIVSQFYGARDKKNLEKTIHTVYALAVAAGIVIGILGLLLSGTILECMNTPGELMKDSLTYLHIYFMGIVFNLVYNMGASALRAMGDSRRPLYVLAVACSLNIVLDLLLVVVFQMGVAGAATATIFCQGISACIVTWMLMSKEKMCSLRLKKIRFYMNSLRSVVRIGIPAGFEAAMYCVANIVIQVFVNRLGTDYVAAWGTFGKIDAAFIVAGAPTSAISNLAASQDVYLVSLDQEHIDALIEQSPYYSANTIAASVYGTPEDVTTVAVNAVLIAREDISDDAAYAIVSNIFNGKGSIGHDKENELDLTFASSVTDVPYHPGAARYFEEQGITVPTE